MTLGLYWGGQEKHRWAANGADMSQSPQEGVLLPEVPWHTEGLFSAHYLTHRLADPKSSAWPPETEADAVFDWARARLQTHGAGLLRGSEEDCEGQWITPLLEHLGFGVNTRKAIPQASSLLLPDYLLYASPALAQAAFLGGKGAYYGQCVGLLEAKKWGLNLSQEGGRGAKKSPHMQIRDYLSESPGLVWGILTNGALWRLYCRHDRASSYFEFDLARVLLSEDEAAARRQFRLFYALFRRAAWERGPGGTCALDAIREGAQQFQEEIERRLRVQVFDCVEILARGFLDNPANGLTTDDLPDIYQNCLILLYRILFVLNAEARELLPTRATDRASTGYVNAYGLQRIRLKLANPADAGEYDDDGQFQLYARLHGLFTLINGRPGPPGKPDKNEQFNIPRYNGGLFDPARYDFLECHQVADRPLADALRRLSYRTDGLEQIAFDYAGLGERHLGSIYEGLLEHRLRAQPDGSIALTNDKGERKTSGAYYTPEAWVAYIVAHTLQPLLAGIDAESLPARQAVPPSPPRRGEGPSVVGNPLPQGEVGRLADPEGVLSSESPDSFAERVLRLNVCDPAMGSGHFLVEATAYLAEAVAAHPTTAPRPLLRTDGTPERDAQTGEPLCTEEAKLAYWKRRIVEACIYGVDLNPLAVELAKLSLWLETVDRVPLNFLDHHLRCGNSLLGTTLAALPDSPRPKKKPAQGGQLSLAFSGDLTDALREAIAHIAAIEGVSTDTHDAAKQKERLWRTISETLMPRFRAVADLWLSPWFGEPLDYAHFHSMFDDPDRAQALRAERNALLSPLRPFHWELEFPDIFFDERGNALAEPGFDAVIGNPPWERMKLQENEFFSGRSPAIALAPKASDRKKLIAALPKTDPALWAAYEAARDRAEQTLAFVHRSGFYPLMGRGDTNLYAVFAEKALQLGNARGRVGLLVPSGIATDDTTKAYFQELVEKKRLAELLDFENRKKVFEDVHSSFKFSVILMTGVNAPQPETRCGFFLHDMDDLNDPERVFTLSPDDFKLFNPNTLTCPIFRRRRDAELTRKIYENVPILVRHSEGEECNPWGISFLRMFDMANDSHLFKTASEMEEEGYWLAEGNVFNKGSVKYLPLYEGKMVQMYDHRAGNVVVNATNLFRPAQQEATTLAEHQDTNFCPRSQYWVDQAKVTATLKPLPHSNYLLGFRDVTAPTNARTVIATIVPLRGTGHKLPLLFVSEQQQEILPCLLANLDSFVLDYSARQKIGGQNLTYFYFQQFPMLPPERYDETWHGVKLADFITARVLELCYTAHDLKGFADDLGFTGPPFAWPTSGATSISSACRRMPRGRWCGGRIGRPCDPRDGPVRSAPPRQHGRRSGAPSAVPVMPSWRSAKKKMCSGTRSVSACTLSSLPSPTRGPGWLFSCSPTIVRGSVWACLSSSPVPRSRRPWSLRPCALCFPLIFSSLSRIAARILRRMSSPSLPISRPSSMCLSPGIGLNRMGSRNASSAR